MKKMRIAYTFSAKRAKAKYMNVYVGIHKYFDKLEKDIIQVRYHERKNIFIINNQKKSVFVKTVIINTLSGNFPVQTYLWLTLLYAINLVEQKIEVIAVYVER